MKHVLFVAFHYPPESSSSGVLRTAKFARYLGDGKPGFVGHCWAKLADAVKWIKDAGGEPMVAGQTFSGVYRDVVTDDDSYDGMICWRISRPLPATICALQPFLQTKDP